MLSALIFFSYFIILNFLLFIRFTTNNINERIWNKIFDLIAIIINFWECSRFANVIHNNASIRSFIMSGNNSPVNFLTACIVVPIPCILTFFYVVIDWYCSCSSIIIKIVLISGQKSSFSSHCQPKNDDLVIWNIFFIFAVERTPIHENLIK